MGGLRRALVSLRIAVAIVVSTLVLAYAVFKGRGAVGWLKPEARDWLGPPDGWFYFFSSFNNWGSCTGLAFGLCAAWCIWIHRRSAPAAARFAWIGFPTVAVLSQLGWLLHAWG